MGEGGKKRISLLFPLPSWKSLFYFRVSHPFLCRKDLQQTDLPPLFFLFSGKLLCATYEIKESLPSFLFFSFSPPPLNDEISEIGNIFLSPAIKKRKWWKRKKGGKESRLYFFPFSHLVGTGKSRQRGRKKYISGKREKNSQKQTVGFPLPSSPLFSGQQTREFNYLFPFQFGKEGVVGLN